MAKTYNTFTDVSAGSVLTASDYNDVLENVGNYRVPPMCLLRRTSNGSNLNASAANVIDFSTSVAEEVVDTDGMHSLSSNASRITPTTAGLYLITGSIQLSTAPQFLDLRLTKNGGTLIAVARLGNQSGGVAVAYTVMNGTTDYVEMVANIGTGTVAVATGNGETTFGAAWQGQVP